MNKPVTEAELQVRTSGQRVTLDDINKAIISEHYFTAEDGVIGSGVTLDTEGQPHSPLSLLTFCVLTLWNGFTVTGQSACADPTNYRKDIGERIAREDAVRQIWPLLGYELRSKIMADRLLVAAAEVEPKEGYDVYIGTKVVNAKPYNRRDYNELRGWTVPADENPNDEGYLVEYTDRVMNPPHVKGFQGYVSWSPKDVFEEAYRAVGPAAGERSGAEPAGAAGAKEDKEDEQLVFEGIGAVALDKAVLLTKLHDERHELANKIMRLEAFIANNHLFASLAREEQQDLREQGSFMRGYLIVLDRRIARHS